MERFKENHSRRRKRGAEPEREGHVEPSVVAKLRCRAWRETHVREVWSVWSALLMGVLNVTETFSRQLETMVFEQGSHLIYPSFLEGMVVMVAWMVKTRSWLRETCWKAVTTIWESHDGTWVGEVGLERKVKRRDTRGRFNRIWCDPVLGQVQSSQSWETQQVSPASLPKFLSQKPTHL